MEFYDKREANLGYAVYPADTSPLMVPPPPVQYSAYSPFSPFVVSTGYYRPAYIAVAPTITTIQNSDISQTQAVQPDAAPAPDRDVTARVIPADVEDAPKIVDVIGLREDQISVGEK